MPIVPALQGRSAATAPGVDGRRKGCPVNPAQLLSHFDRISEAPDAIPRLRRFILDLAVRGKLVEQERRDEPVIE